MTVENKASGANTYGRPSENRNRYDMSLPQSFSAYNDEGNIIYRGDVEQLANSLRAEIFGVDPDEAMTTETVKQKEPKRREENKEKAKKKEKSSVYTKRRGFFLIIPIILSVAMLVIAICGLFGTSFDNYISLYNYGEEQVVSFTYMDPFVSFISSKFGVNAGTVPAKFGAYFDMGGTDFLSAFVGYALPIATVLYMLLAIIMLIVAAVRLIQKKNSDGSYVKARMGFLSIMMFLCGLLTAVSGVRLAGSGVSDIGGFIAGSARFSAGYGLFAMIVVPIITFICTCLAYGKGEVADKGKK